MCVYFLGITLGSTKPMAVLRMVIMTRARIAPRKTADRLCFILKTAAMKNVLSPISVAIIMAKEDVNAFQKP